MSDAAEKPFEATPQRLEKAKREGNVARAGECAANLAFAAAACAAAAVAPMLGAAARSAIVTAASGGVPAAACARIAEAALVPLAFGAAAGALASALQNGGMVLVAVAPKLERLNPLEGVKRMLSRETLAHALRAALAFAAATTAMAPVLAECASALVRAGGVFAVAAAAWKAAQQVAWSACAVGLIFSVAEYGSARRIWLRKLRMSFEERKRDAKEQEGDPVARGRRRALHRGLSRGAVARVKEASFVVVNPVHVAVALAYRPPEIAVPHVLVRAAGDAALRVRALAQSYRIPVVENVALARALYREARAGEPIPHACYVAVAEVVAALLRTKEAAR